MKLLHIRNPIMPTLDCRAFELDHAASVGDALDAADWHLMPSTFLVRRDLADNVDWRTARARDVFVPRRAWDAEIFEADETAVLVTLPRGGGQGGSNVLTVVAQLALLVAAAFIAGPWGVGAWLGAELGVSAAIGAAVVFGSVMIAGQMLLQAILPMPKSPPTPQPYFTIGVQSNGARLGQAIPERFGRTNFGPDLRSQAYVEYDNNAENIYELFCLGVGSFYVEQLRIGTNVIAQADDTGTLQPTGAYPEITWQLCGPNEPVTLFPDNVVTSTEVSDIELLGTNQLNYAWTSWFVANPPNTQTTLLALDMEMPGGCYNTGDTGAVRAATISWQFEAQLIDDNGLVIGAPFTISASAPVYETNQPLYFTVECNVPCGRYQVRGERTNTVPTDSNQSPNTLIWAALRAYLPSQQYYGNSTMLAILATASYNLSQESADSINVVATRILTTPVEIDGVWQWSASPQATRSIGAAANYLLSSVNNAGLDPSQYDQNWLLSYEALWQSRGDTLDGGFASQQSFWDMLTAALNVGRTQALAGPFIGFVRDEQQTTYRCAFSPRTMLKDTFNINYLFFDPNKDADCFTLNYIDESNWTPQQLFIALPDATDTIDTAPQVTVSTMVSRAQIWREWNYKLAASAFRRIFPTFQTELDGRVCFRGDRVRLSHVMTQWGMSADVVAIAAGEEGAGDVLTLSEPWIVGQDGQPTIQMTSPDGYLCGPANVTIIDDGDMASTASPGRAIVQLTEPLAPTEGNYNCLDPIAWGIWGLGNTDARRDLQRERPRVLMGQGTELPVDALVVSMTPRANLQAELQCVIDDPRVYTADEAAVPPYTVGSCDGGNPNLTITGLEIEQSTGVYIDGNDVVLDVEVIGANDGGTFDYQYSLNGAAWVGPVTGNGRSFTFRIPGGAMRLQVRGVADDGEPGIFYERDFDASGTGIIGAGLNFSLPSNSQYLPVLMDLWS